MFGFHAVHLGICSCEQIYTLENFNTATFYSKGKAFFALHYESCSLTFLCFKVCVCADECMWLHLKQCRQYSLLSSSGFIKSSGGGKQWPCGTKVGPRKI